jgi:multidrug efflux pump
VNGAKGGFDGPARSYTIGANDQLTSSADYRPIVVAYRNGAPVRLATSPTSSTTPRTSARPRG